MHHFAFLFRALSLKCHCSLSQILFMFCKVGKRHNRIHRKKILLLLMNHLLVFCQHKYSKDYFLSEIDPILSGIPAQSENSQRKQDKHCYDYISWICTRDRSGNVLLNMKIKDSPRKYELKYNWAFYSQYPSVFHQLFDVLNFYLNPV